MLHIPSFAEFVNEAKQEVITAQSLVDEISSHFKLKFKSSDFDSKIDTKNCGVLAHIVNDWKLGRYDDNSYLLDQDLDRLAKISKISTITDFLVYLESYDIRTYKYFNDDHKKALAALEASNNKKVIQKIITDYVKINVDTDINTYSNVMRKYTDFINDTIKKLKLLTADDTCTYWKVENYNDGFTCFTFYSGDLVKLESINKELLKFQKSLKLGNKKPFLNILNSATGAHPTDITGAYNLSVYPSLYNENIIIQQEKELMVKIREFIETLCKKEKFAYLPAR